MQNAGIAIADKTLNWEVGSLEGGVLPRSRKAYLCVIMLQDVWIQTSASTFQVLFPHLKCYATYFQKPLWVERLTVHQRVFQTSKH